MNFGQKVQMLRKNNGISQDKLATAIGVNRNLLSRVETGKSEATESVIVKISKYFNIDTNTLLLDNNTPKKNTEEKIKIIEENCHNLIESDLDLIIRIISILREECVKKDL